MDRIDDPFYSFDRRIPPVSGEMSSSHTIYQDEPTEFAQQGEEAIPLSGAGGFYHPFQGLDASDGVAKIKFIYGTVGNASPTFGGNPVFPESDEATVSNDDKVYLDATVDSAGAITSLIASRAASVPADNAPAGHYYRLLFTVAVSGGAVTNIGQSVTTNLTLFICNGNAIWERA